MLNLKGCLTGVPLSDVKKCLIFVVAGGRIIAGIHNSEGGWR